MLYMLIRKLRKITMPVWFMKPFPALRAVAIAPFVPHVTEELWHGVIDAHSSVHAQSWPKAEAEAMKVDNVEIVLQVNGKVKGRLVVPAEAGREELEKLALADEHIAAMVDVGKIVKIVCVPGRLVNIVARP